MKTEYSAYEKMAQLLDKQYEEGLTKSESVLLQHLIKNNPIDWDDLCESIAMDNLSA